MTDDGPAVTRAPSSALEDDLMMRTFGVVAFVMALLAVTPAHAQTAGATPASPLVNSWYLGANTGLIAVERAGGVFGLDGGLRRWRNLDLIGELVWGQDLVTRSQLSRVDTLAAAVAQRAGGTATGDMTVPGRYAGLGARWVMERGSRLRPYAQLTIGGAHTTREPVITLAGTDVTAQAGQYGVTLGQDVIGSYNHVASSVGIGVVLGVGSTWYADLGLRLLSASTQEQQINATRLVIGAGYRF